jgi:hypothetical protein
MGMPPAGCHPDLQRKGSNRQEGFSKHFRGRFRFACHEEGRSPAMECRGVKDFATFGIFNALKGDLARDDVVK